jgi:hypothetical protein
MYVETVCKKINKHNFHPYLQQHKIPENQSLIFVGPKHTGKYSQILYFLSTKLCNPIKQMKKICIPLQKDAYITKISNVHIEVDFYSFGCNAKHMWHTIYQHIISILNSTHKTLDYIVCKNFEYIHPELLDIFYYYIKEKKIRFILHTTSVCFLNHYMLNLFHLIHIQCSSDTKQISYFDYSSKPFYDILTFIKSGNGNDNNQDKHDFYSLREKIYFLFIYHYDISELLLYLFRHIYTSFHCITYKRKLVSITNKFYKQYYNNFRSIYHLEAIIVNYKDLYDEYRHREKNIRIAKGI